MALGFNAAAKTAVCNACATDYDYSSRARTVALQGGGVGPHYIVNSLSGVTKKYTAFWKDLGEGVTSVVVTEKPVESSVTNFVNFVKQKNGSLISINLREDLPENAYELIEFPQLQRNAGAYIKETGVGFTQDLLTYLNAVGSLVGFSANAISITVKIVMPDSSTALYVYNHTTQTWDRVPGQTKDASGNFIPETKEGFSGGPGSITAYYFYNPNDLVNFLNRARDLGIPITGPVGNIGSVSTGGVTIVCQGTGCTDKTSDK